MFWSWLVHFCFGPRDAQCSGMNKKNNFPIVLEYSLKKVIVWNFCMTDIFRREKICRYYLFQSLVNMIKVRTCVRNANLVSDAGYLTRTAGPWVKNPNATEANHKPKQCSWRSVKQYCSAGTQNSPMDCFFFHTF